MGRNPTRADPFYWAKHMLPLIPHFSTSLTSPHLLARTCIDLSFWVKYRSVQVLARRGRMVQGPAWKLEVLGIPRFFSLHHTSLPGPTPICFTRRHGAGQELGNSQLSCHPMLTQVSIRPGIGPSMET